MTDTGPGADPPSPFSREGSQAADGLGAEPSPGSSAEPFELYPPPAGGDPYPSPGAYAGPYPAATPYPASSSTPPAPGFDPQPTPPYGSDGAAAPYPASSPGYGSNPYEYPSYQPTYGGTVPYGAVQVQVSHPKATTAMVFGILGIVLGLSCGIGGFLGIAGIVQGRRARGEIDAEPGRYSGRSQAVAGIVTGVIGVVIAALVVVFVVLAIVFYASTPGDF